MTSLASFAIAASAELSLGMLSSQRPTNNACSVASLLGDIRDYKEGGRGVWTQREEKRNIGNRGISGGSDKIKQE